MKTYKNIKDFEERIKNKTDWADYMKIGGRVYKLYEYGDSDNHQYCYWVNKRTHDAIKIDYKLNPAYEFYSLMFIKDMDLWRTDTL